MKNFLLKMKVSGIKNIDREIELNFCNKSLPEDADFLKFNVKAVYGPNGAGKTGLIYAAEIYRNLVFDDKYITLGNADGSLANLINQISKEFCVTMSFACISEQNKIADVYSHTFRINEINGDYKLVEEKFSRLSDLNANNEDKYRTVFHVKDGVIVELFNGCKYVDELKTSTMNLLGTQSLLSAFFAATKTKNNVNVDNDLLNYFVVLLDFIDNLTVVLQDTDKNYINFQNFKKQFEAIKKQQQASDDDTFMNLLNRNRIPGTSSKRILKENFDEHVKYVENLCKFIKVFKSDLKEIEIKKDENGDFYECEYILIYENGKRINEKFESTGIKRIMNMYSALCDVDAGKIVFIDEFDANIHDVLLIKLVEYVKQFAAGQLIFTTHNLGPMSVLEKEKKAIDFLSPNSRITSWTNSGNYSVESQYRKGMIKYSPFNIEAFSFLGVFGENDK